jgi:hypothetical protein
MVVRKIETCVRFKLSKLGFVIGECLKNVLLNVPVGSQNVIFPVLSFIPLFSGLLPNMVMFIPSQSSVPIGDTTLR